MAREIPVYNVSRNCFMRRKQAERGVENCAFAWVEQGISVRKLSLAEAICARNQQARNREPLPFAEIPGIVFRFEDQAATRHESQLAAQANRFVEQAA